MPVAWVVPPALGEDQLTFRVRQPGRMCRIAEEHQPHEHPNTARSAGQDECHAPPDDAEQPGYDYRANRGAKCRSGCEDGHCIGAFLDRCPFAHRAGTQGKSRRFAKTQRESRGKQEAVAERPSGQGRRRRPETKADRGGLTGTPPVEDHSRRQLHRRIGPDERREQIA